MRRVIARIKGGLGNQLFCYAAARRLALVNDAELVIDDVSGFARDQEYRRMFALDHFRIEGRKATHAERLEPFERYRRKLRILLAQRKPFLERSYIVQEGVDFDRRILELRVDGTVYLDGLWQSEGYFKDVESTIRADLEIDPPTDTLNRLAAERIRRSNSVALHVRWFDQPDGAGGYNVPFDYYARAVQLMERLTECPHYFIYSDDPALAQSLLQLPQDRATCISHNGAEMAYADLWLMSACRNFITANSTFSWWGAWLGRAPDKIVISPRVTMQGKAAWGFDGLIPAGWLTL